MIYQFRQCYVQMEMGQALKDPNFHFQKLTLSLNDFQKYKINDHEVSIAGEMPIINGDVGWLKYRTWAVALENQIRFTDRITTFLKTGRAPGR